MKTTNPSLRRLAVRLLCIASSSAAGLAAEPGGRSGQVRLNELTHSSPELRIAAQRDLQTSLDPRIPEAMIPLRANWVVWHPRKEFVAFHMSAGRRPLGVWVWRHRQGLRKIEHGEIIKSLAIGRNMKPALYILDLDGWHGDELRFRVDVGLLGTKSLGWNATSGVLRELSPGPKKDGR